MNASKSKGTAWETAITNYLTSRGFDGIERRAPQGSIDRGDIAGISGVVIEAKNHRTLALSSWLKELQLEVDNDGASLGLLCVKRRGYVSPEDAYWIIDPRHVPAVINALKAYPRLDGD